MSIRFQYNFHSVGQGLFASGYLSEASRSQPNFVWVYDCGTSSSRGLLADGICELTKESKGRGVLDLVAISHFDQDHINGISQLLGKFRIDTLLLPYMPLWKRMLIAFEERVSINEGLIGFFLDPTSFLLSVPGAQVGRIIYVLPTDVDGGVPTDDRGRVPPGPAKLDRDPKIHFECERPKEYEEMRLLHGGAGQTAIEFLKRGSRITIQGVWEFVPYNDDSEIDAPLEFQQWVAALRDQLLNHSSRRGRERMLGALQRKYDRMFGRGDEQRNSISLFLYAGPLYESWRCTRLIDFHTRPQPRTIGRRSIRARRPSGFDPSKCSILYTGDGYLDTSEKLGRLISFLTNQRVNRLAVLQVMHHGAEGNWHRGVAAALAPTFSAFSSDPDHKKFGHPHAVVLRDFWRYGPVQIDKTSGAIWTGVITSNEYE